MGTPVTTESCLKGTTAPHPYVIPCEEGISKMFNPLVNITSFNHLRCFTKIIWFCDLIISYKPLFVESTIKNRGSIVEIAELQELTRKSLNLTWKNYLSNDWLPEEKAYNFPIDKFYVDLKWIKMVKEALKTMKLKLTSIYDVVAAATGGTNILVQGNEHYHKKDSHSVYKQIQTSIKK